MLIHKNDSWNRLSKKRVHYQVLCLEQECALLPPSLDQETESAFPSSVCDTSPEQPTTPGACNWASKGQSEFGNASPDYEWKLLHRSTAKHCEPMEITKGMCNTVERWKVERRKELESWGKVGVAVIQTEETEGQKADKWKSKREETKWSENSEGKEQAEVAGAA